MKSSRAIALLSGGLDSVVSAWLARAHHDVICAVTCDYGQRAAVRENESAAFFCTQWDIPHRMIALPWLGDCTHTSLVNRGAALPRFEKNPHALDEPTRTRDSAAAVWVPNRNGVFIHVAAALAESMSAQYVVTGFNVEEAATFSDNSAEFVQRTNAALALSTRNQVQVVSYTQTMTKTDMMRVAQEHAVQITHCWPCYEGGAHWCRACESCARFLRAAAQAGVTL